jgi:glycine dehydrogenase subunit 1
VQYPDILGSHCPIWPPLSCGGMGQGRAAGRVVTEPVALGADRNRPESMGADIVVGEGQSLGVGLQFGGPYLGLFGCNEKFVRQMPGGSAARRSMRKASAASC